MEGAARSLPGNLAYLRGPARGAVHGPAGTAAIDAQGPCLDTVIVADDEPLPDHVRVAGAIRAAIDGGLLEAGDHLPSRPHLAHEHGVSVAAVSRALRLLIDEGLIAARQPHGFSVRPTQAVTQGTFRRLLTEASDLLAALEPMASPEVQRAIAVWRQQARRAGAEC